MPWATLELIALLERVLGWCPVSDKLDFVPRLMVWLLIDFQIDGKSKPTSDKLGSSETRKICAKPPVPNAVPRLLIEQLGT